MSKIVKPLTKEICSKWKETDMAKNPLTGKQLDTRLKNIILKKCADFEDVSPNTFLKNRETLMKTAQKHLFDPKPKHEINEINDRMNAFLNGFDSFHMRDILQQKGVNTYTLNSMLSVFEVTNELVEKLVSKLEFLGDIHHPVTRYLPEILLSFGSDYPDSEMSIPREADESLESYNKRKRDEFKLFITKLLGFFSGVPRLLNNTRYGVNIVQYRDGQLPTSHMCFIKIDIPDYINTKKMLYKKLIQSVFMTANATTQAGGRNIRSRRM